MEGHDRADEETAIGGDGPVFEPRLYLQRYFKVADLVQALCPNADLLMDFGAAEGKFIRQARENIDHRLNNVTHFVGVDIDKDLLQNRASYALRGISYNFQEFCQYKRHRQLVQSLYAGSVLDFDPRFAHVDVITAIELVEHLTLNDVQLFTDNVFGRYRPRLVVVTTPNSEFNVLFPELKKGEFRHWDHKFEWTRAEFRAWAEGVVKQHPDYELRFEGVGNSHTHPEVGPCSQIAVFCLPIDLYPSIKAEKEAIREPLPEPGTKLVLMEEFEEDGPVRVTRASPEAKDGVDGRYTVVWHERLPWNRLSRHRGRLASALKTALYDLAEPLRDSDQAETVGNKVGVYIPLADIANHPSVSRYTTDVSELQDHILGTDDSDPLDPMTGGFWYLFELIDEGNTTDEGEDDPDGDGYQGHEIRGFDQLL